jgi:hypothetical protein
MSAPEQLLAFRSHRGKAAADEQDALGHHEIEHRRHRFRIEIGELRSRHAHDLVRRQAGDSSTSAIICCATMCHGSGGGVMCSTYFSRHSVVIAQASRKGLVVVVRNRQLRRLPVRRPVRPMRCRNEDTVLGESIWIT